MWSACAWLYDEIVIVDVSDHNSIYLVAVDYEILSLYYKILSFSHHPTPKGSASLCQPGIQRWLKSDWWLSSYTAAVCLVWGAAPSRPQGGMVWGWGLFLATSAEDIEKTSHWVYLKVRMLWTGHSLLSSSCLQTCACVVLLSVILY